MHTPTLLRNGGEYRVNKCSRYLWLNGKKVYDIRTLRENFDTPVLTGYFLGGSLMKWLSDLGEADIVKRLSSVDIYGDIGTQLEFAFGVSPDKRADTGTAVRPANPPVIRELPVSAADARDAGIASSFYRGDISSFNAHNAILNIQSSFTGAESSFYNLQSSFFGAETAVSASSASSFNIGSSFGALLSAGAGAGVGVGSFTSSFFGSYSAFLTGQALFTGSFGFGSGGSFNNLFNQRMLYFWSIGSFGSFTLGSFGGYEWLFGRRGYGQGSFGSFSLGSFGAGFGFGFGQGSFLYGSGGSFTLPYGLSSGGSFVTIAPNVTVTAEEYRRTLINLSSCPLNAYGYGINLV